MLDQEVREHLEVTEVTMQAAIEHLEKELVKVRAGKASPAMLDGLLVEYYGTPTPLNQVANVSTSDARTIVIQPWEKKMLAAIERAIFEANLGITPQNDGEVVRLGIPPLTEERRKDMVKKVKAIGEDTKVGIRSHRRDGMDFIKKAVKNGLPEDFGKQMEGSIDEMTKKFIDDVDKILAAKEKDIMTV
ncbi:MAG TPA: ribosome recycling factor [Saprospiraceae bacterium]|nr:ribosome recycling factor [Saprospiraceae bacterium]HMQ82285.1 ribosome recycling factor [Saprospiraceae bacterium]